MANVLLYGANGYTGDLIAREAARRGRRLVLAGRNADGVRRLAAELGFESRVFSLADAARLDAGLAGVDIVLHCAGPFAHTSQHMADACLRTHKHYLDITGEISVFEALAARDAEARSAEVLLLPGVGFDVVPTDCLALHLKNRLPSASRLTLALHTSGHMSRGTATTIVEYLAHGGVVRQDGRLVGVPLGWKTRDIDFGSGPMRTTTIPWGDLATAYRTTGIGNIEVYSARAVMPVPATLRAVFGWVVGRSSMQRLLKKRIQLGPPGPTDEQRAAGWTKLWGEVSDDAGQKVATRLSGPEGYTFTVLTALAVLDKLETMPIPTGFNTPATLFGADFVLGTPGVARKDIDPSA